MRTDASQLPIPLDAPLDVVLSCRSEADAVRKCLRLAMRRYGRNQKQVAAMCGWKSDSCLSEAVKDNGRRGIPQSRLHRFALATGCNLVEQYRERVQAEARLKGLLIHRDEADRAADACLAAWGMAA